MTYCVAMKLDEGLVCLSDTRTNAGIDNINRYKKTFTFQGPDRAIVLMTAGNLSVTQGVIERLSAAIGAAEAPSVPDASEPIETVYTVPTLYRLAEIVGQEMRGLIDRHGPAMEKDGVSAGASIIIAGEIGAEGPRLFLVYSAGNFIECETDTPYFQIGEAKYGKPIIERTIGHDTPLAEAVRTALVSMDLTVRSNLSVGLPLDLTVIRTGTRQIALERRITEDDGTYGAISEGWADALRQGLASLPGVDDWLR